MARSQPGKSPAPARRRFGQNGMTRIFQVGQTLKVSYAPRAMAPTPVAS